VGTTASEEQTTQGLNTEDSMKKIIKSRDKGLLILEYDAVSLG
jgi:hypothetical protein